mmetsp:Transcript_59234/g.170117  ORF Transcript_59234/g.170117 Transcript_59234/m.170117 type:complete len:345 (-) Transcript_59234:33-1067(-)
MRRPVRMMPMWRHPHTKVSVHPINIKQRHAVIRRDSGVVLLHVLTVLPGRCRRRCCGDYGGVPVERHHGCQHDLRLRGEAPQGPDGVLHGRRHRAQRAEGVVLRVVQDQQVGAAAGPVGHLRSHGLVLPEGVHPPLCEVVARNARWESPCQTPGQHQPVVATLATLPPVSDTGDFRGLQANRVDWLLAAPANGDAPAPELQAHVGIRVLKLQQQAPQAAEVALGRFKGRRQGDPVDIRQLACQPMHVAVRHPPQHHRVRDRLRLACERASSIDDPKRRQRRLWPESEEAQQRGADNDGRPSERKAARERRHARSVMMLPQRSLEDSLQPLVPSDAAISNASTAT